MIPTEFQRHGGDPRDQMGVRDDAEDVAVQITQMGSPWQGVNVLRGDQYADHAREPTISRRFVKGGRNQVLQAVIHLAVKKISSQRRRMNIGVTQIVRT